MDKPLGRFFEWAYPRRNIWGHVVSDLRPPVELDHFWALPLAALAEVQNTMDTCAEYLDRGCYVGFAAC